MKNRFTMVLAALAIVFTMSVTALAAGGRPAGALNGNPKAMNNYAVIYSGGISDGNFTLMINQAVVTGKRARIVFSLKAWTPEAQERLMNLEGNDLDIRCSLDGRELVYNIVEQPWVYKDDTRSWILTADGIENEGLEPVYISPGIIDIPEEKKEIRIVAESYKELSIPLLKQPGGGNLSIDPIGITVTRTWPEKTVETLDNLGIYFRMTDGSIKSFNQLFSLERTFMLVSFEPAIYEFSAMSKEVLTLSRLKSVAVDGVEYDLRASNWAPFQAPEELYAKTFTFVRCSEGFNDIDVERLFTDLGAEPEWNSGRSVLTVNYNGIRAEINVDGDLVVVNGGYFRLGHPAHMSGDRLMVDADFIDYVIKLSYIAVDRNAPLDERVYVIYP